MLSCICECFGIDIPEEIYYALFNRYKQLTYVEIERPIRRYHREPKRFQDFINENNWSVFKFRQEDLPRLLNVFKLTNEYYILDNKSKFSNEEILMIGLMRYSSNEESNTTVLCQRFELDPSQISRVYNFFTRYILDNFSDLIGDNLNYWSNSFHTFSEKIRMKANSIGGNYPENSLKVFGFHHCTTIEGTRVGGGSVNTGSGSRPHDTHIQRAFYSGYKKNHGIKYLSVEGPNGLCLYMYGPCSAKDSDNKLITDSDLNKLIANSQIHLPMNDYVSYGDRIFIIESHVKGKHIGEVTAAEIQENRIMTSLRVANDWSNGVSKIQFPYVKNKLQNKVLLSEMAPYKYVVATILRNAKVCLYHGDVSSYFDCSPPTLEDYFESI